MYRSHIDPERMLDVPIRRHQSHHAERVQDTVSIEEPLDVRVGAETIAVIMRTPGHDAELAIGFLVTEGVITAREQVIAIDPWRDHEGSFAENMMTVTLPDEVTIPDERRRRFYATSSCGMCGKASIEAALLLAPPLMARADVRASLLYGLPAKLRETQMVFDRTGGLHAAGLFDTHGTLIEAREDVGRHNAVDKLIGRAFLDGRWPLDGCILMVSGRVSFEIVQKALVARIATIAAVSAPTSLAVQTARRANIALVGFLRGDSLNEY